MASGVFLMGTEEFIDFLNDNRWVVNTTAQAFHGAPVGAGAIDDVVHELAVFCYYTMGIQQCQGWLTHHVGMDMLDASHHHTCSSCLAHGFVGDEGSLQHFGTLTYQCLQVFNASLCETVNIPVFTSHDKGQSLIVQDFN